MATPVTTTRHRWLKYTVEGGDVIVDPRTGKPYFVERDERSIGEQVACAACSEPLTSGSATTACLPTDTD